MNGYEKLIKLMRDEGSKKNPPSLKLGVMQSSRICKVGSLSLDSDDLYYASHLVNSLAKNDMVLVYKISDEKYVIIEKVVSE